MSRLLGECPSPIFSEGRTEVARQVIDSLKRWLNTKSEARPNLTVISNELAQADSWTSANRRLRLLPAVLARNYQQPGAFSGTDLMLARALDLLTTGRRQDSVEAFLQVGEILPTLNLTETQRLDRILAISNRHFNPQPIGTISPLFLNRGTFQTYLNDAHTIAQIRLARAAVLVEEFRRKEGRIPWTETEISEVNFGTWPAEPFSGKPYKLVRTSHGYRIEFAAPVPRILTPRKRLLIGAKEEANVFEVHASP